MNSGLWKCVLPVSGWRAQACWILGPLSVLGVVLVSETAAERGTVGAVERPGHRDLLRPPPKVTILNPSVHALGSIGQDNEETSRDVEGEPPHETYRVRASNAARFRTWCVRLCDGYYYPINYLTTRGRLQADEERCRASCSSEARLYVNAVIGRTAAPLADLSGQPYTDLPTAFAYRAAFNPDCTCDGSRMLVTSSTAPPSGLDEHDEDKDPFRMNIEAGR